MKYNFRVGQRELREEEQQFAHVFDVNGRDTWCNPTGYEVWDGNAWQAEYEDPNGNLHYSYA